MDVSSHSESTSSVRRGSSGEDSLRAFVEEEERRRSAGSPPPMAQLMEDLMALPPEVKVVGLDDFAVLSKLGEGGFGKVVLAKKCGGTLHAIKAVRKEKLLKAGAGAVQHMLDENNILQTLRHPFILTLIERERILSEAMGRFYAAQLASAFAYLHDHGVVYRDLKPENVLLGLDGYVVLADFGLAKTLVLGDANSPKANKAPLATKSLDSFPEKPPRRPRTSIHKAETFCGTPLYLAPEVVSRVPYGRSVDWWALGCLLVEMLTGKPPFVAADLPELMDLIKEARPAFKDCLGDAARDACAGLLARDPADRLGCGPGGFDELARHVLRSRRLGRARGEDAGGALPPGPGDGDDRADVGRVRESGGLRRRVQGLQPLRASVGAAAGAGRRGPEPVAKRRVSELNDAARDGDVDAPRGLVLGGAPVTLCDYDRRTPPTSPRRRATRRRGVLIGPGRGPGRPDRWGGTPLDDAQREATPVARLLLSTSGGVEDPAARLFAAARDGDVARVDVLLLFGADVARVDRFGQMPWTTPRGSGATRSALVRRAARAATTPPLELLDARAGDVPRLEALLRDHDANAAGYDDRTPLHLAAAEGHADAVALLLDRGAAVDAADRLKSVQLGSMASLSSSKRASKTAPPPEPSDDADVALSEARAFARQVKANIALRREEAELVRSERLPDATPEMLREKRRADRRRANGRCARTRTLSAEALGHVSPALGDAKGMASFLRRAKAVQQKRAAEAVADPGGHGGTTRGDLWTKHATPVVVDPRAWKGGGSRVVEHPASPGAVDGAKSLEQSKHADEDFDFFALHNEVMERVRANLRPLEDLPPNRHMVNAAKVLNGERLEGEDDARRGRPPAAKAASPRKSR
ncbi:hypothetical protein JL721_6619 [Aureococcus anophagefferens]|nr:hypothetical protein JL721_6619 [Aureococcus anophagefferens]